MANKSPNKLDVFENLSQDWNDVFSSQEFSDVQIVSGEQVFDCHQVVLAARSPVFRAMFLSNMTEKETRKVEIPDLYPEVISEMLCFIYTGKTPELDKLAEDLLVAADKYQLDQLKSICVDNLCKKIDVKNCLNFLVIGDIYGADLLKKSSLNFVYRNKGWIFKYKDWKENLERYPNLM